MPEAGPKTVERFEGLAETFVARGATRSQMFGMPVLKAGDKVFAGTFGDAMTFKLGPDDLERARALTGVEPFEPMKGSPNEGVGAGPARAREALVRPRGASVRLPLVMPADLISVGVEPARPTPSLHAR